MWCWRCDQYELTNSALLRVALWATTFVHRPISQVSLTSNQSKTLKFSRRSTPLDEFPDESARDNKMRSYKREVTDLNSTLSMFVMLDF